MLPNSFNSFADSPTLLLSPQYHPLFAASSSAHTFRYQPFVPIMPSNPSSNPDRMSKSPSPPSTASPRLSRKRSAGTMSALQTSFDEDDDVNMGVMPPSRTPAISPDAILGPPMNTIDTMTGRRASPRGQSGTWFSDTLSQKLTSNLDETPNALGDDGQASKRSCIGGDGSSEVSDFAYSTPPTGTQTPGLPTSEVDEYSCLLGVGWKKPNNHPDTLAAIRGYCKYIDKHYPLRDVEIMLQNKSKEQYLVKTGEGYFLFREDLAQGRLISRQFWTALARLQDAIPQFEGPEPVCASSSPIVDPADDQEAVEGMDVSMDQ